MKHVRIIIVIMAIQLSITSITYSQSKWWQREIPAPSANQIINPNYSSKRRDLEKTSDDINEMYRLKQQKQRIGQSTRAEDDYLQHLGKKMNTLEYELSKIPLYITNPNYDRNKNAPSTIRPKTDIYISTPSESGSPPTSTNSYLLTLYKINNCNRNELNTDYEFNAESLNLFNELKSNISKIANSESSFSFSSVDFIKEKIKYYKIFFTNWGSGTTIGTKEALKEINQLQDDIDKKERYRLLHQTYLDVKIHIQGYLPEQLKIRDGIGKWHYRRYYTVCIIHNLEGLYDGEHSCREHRVKNNYGGCIEETSIKYIKVDKLTFKITYGTKVDDSGNFDLTLQEMTWLNKGEETIVVPIIFGESKYLNIDIIPEGLSSTRTKWRWDNN